MVGGMVLVLGKLCNNCLKKNWYNSEMVVFTKIVIILAVSDGFLKFQKF